MRYTLLFVTREDDADAFENLNDEGRARMYGRIAEWAKKYESKLGVGEQLQPPEAATTVRFPGRFRRDEAPTVSDGPFIEGKEIIGGYWVIDVADLDEALQMAKEWPASTMVEVRPILERTS
jgi:hypothetical protein